MSQHPPVPFAGTVRGAGAPAPAVPPSSAAPGPVPAAAAAPAHAADPAHAGAAVLAARGLTKTYGTTTALAGVDLTVRRGESVAIMGASGSGKTTLLHCLAGIVRPDGGDVRLATAAGDVVVSALNEAGRSRLRREQFGFVFQEGLLLPELTALENVAVALMLGGAARPAAEHAAAGWLHALGLAGMEHRRIGQLSGGQAQRVAIARAQVTGAPVTFADEPTGALDSATSAEVMDLLLGATTGTGRTLVVVTHDEGVAARCTRVVRLRDGRVVAEHAGGAR
ncbi:ABC transporter ATP-binding protein [Georgenia ruanii]|uniref:ATP-binding cassette domain-containing protein n=1 Tax=Georgenia ruanii TaxID=348442 RepID=A0A7J9UZ75_9MICO|nr:ABC transporter ATP-binding protein [Georgenia ruanii]MPV89938.1 ATP-binding cassette domain-containing protein [Georgenia ruanii]